MEAIWNRVDLERPPNASCHVDRQKFDAKGFLKILGKCIKSLKSQASLHKEAALLSRLIYRMKGKFRNDKGVKSMGKVNRALLNYLSLSLEKEYEYLKSYVEVEGKYIKLPTKQMVQYVLIRTQGFAKLMSRVEEVSKHSAHFLRSRIALGHAWCVSTIAYSVVSRIWILSRHLTKLSCRWYNNLYEYLTFFKAPGLNWLPEDYELPDDLHSWLSLPWINEPIPKVPREHSTKNIMFKLLTQRDHDSDEDITLDVDDCGTKRNVVNASPHIEKENMIYDLVSKGSNKNVTSNDDTGEAVDRRSFYSNCVQRKSNTFTNDENVPTSIKEQKCKRIMATKEEPRQQISRSHKKSQIPFESTEDAGISIQRDNKCIKKPKNLFEKKDSQKLLRFENVKNKSELLTLLNKESYPGVDKLQWNMIRKKSRKLLNKLDDECSDETKQAVSFKTVIKRIERWIT